MRLPRLAALACPALALAGLACGREASTSGGPQELQAPTRPHAPGTVLTVDGLELSATELDGLCADVQDLYPEHTRVHARRLALTNEFLPRLAARAATPEAWSAARKACTDADPSTLEPLRLEGTFQGLGLGLWSAARHLALDAWSGPVELVGRFVRLRLRERSEALDPREERLVVEVLDFPYVDPLDGRAAIEAAIDAARLTVLDPAVEKSVPEAWKHRMRGSRP